jgi:hypothetical protein
MAFVAGQQMGGFDAHCASEDRAVFPWQINAGRKHPRRHIPDNMDSSEEFFKPAPLSIPAQVEPGFLCGVGAGVELNAPQFP